MHQDERVIRLTQADIEATLEQILSSKLFVKAARLRELLRYLVNAVLSGEAQKLTAHAIGVDFFCRDSAYDSTKDNIVRVNTGRLRHKLNQYFDSQPPGTDNVRIELPERCFAPVFLVDGQVVSAITTVTPSAEITASHFNIDRQFTKPAIITTTFAVLLLLGYVKWPWWPLAVESQLEAVATSQALGDNYFTQGDYRSALQYYRRASDADAANSYLLRRIGKVEFALARYDQALSTFTLLLKSDQQDNRQSAWVADDFRWLANTHENMGHFDDALTLITQSVRIAAETVEPGVKLASYYNDIARIQAHSGLYQLAGENSDKALILAEQSQQIDLTLL
ncbi:MAG: tetratricopeptide repeat protein, partial [Psychrosphaera sp.]|nr:tetratricopeptide repeat protein [Psychrosphaera sp.]